MSNNNIVSAIREIALATLAKNKDGLRLVALYRLVSVVFGNSIDQTQIKNAVWNIDEIYPDFVTKQKISTKFVILTPTPKLIEHMQYMFEDDSEVAASAIETEISYDALIANLTGKIIELDKQIQSFSFDKVLSDYLNRNFTEQETDALFHLKVAFDYIRKARNILVHSSRQRDGLTK